MHRCGSGFLLTLAIAFVLALTGCLGKSSSNSGNGGVSSITLSPSGALSLDVGGTLIFGVTAKNADGGPVFGADIQFLVASGTPNAPAPLTVASNGKACAGTWDTTDSICSPGIPGIAIVTAVTSGVSSTPATVYVHQHVDSIQISSITPPPPPPPPQLYPCFSQGQTWEYAATAYSGTVDITNSVGPISWSSSNAGVVTATPYVNPQQPNVLNLVQTTAKAPGITQLFASVSGTTSSPYPYTTCLIQAIYLQIGGDGSAGNSITVNNDGSVPVMAIAVDTLCGIANNTALASPPLTWSTTDPEVAAFGTTTNSTGTNTATARNNLGGATLTASCTPPTCNIGLPGLTPSGLEPSLPIYASDYPANPIPGCQPPNLTKGYGTISVDVTSTSTLPTYSAWAATTDCQNQPGCISALFKVTPGLVPISTIVSLPRTPNSMIFNHVLPPRVYFGSNQGLMYVDISTNPAAAVVSNSLTCNVALCGTVLTISNNGKLVVVGDTVSTPSQVYIYNAGSASTAPVDLVLSKPGETATAAAFSPDQLKLFVLTNQGNMYVYSTVDAFTVVPPLTTGNTTFSTPANAVISSMDGSFAYVAVQPVPTVFPAPPIPGFVSGFANCDTPATQVEPLGDVATNANPLINANPLALYPLPTLQLDSMGNPTEVVLALDTPEAQENAAPPPPPTTIDMFGVNVTQFTLAYDKSVPAYNEFACNPPSVALDANFPRTSINLGQGNFTPIYSQLVADGTEMIILGKGIPSVLLFDVSNGNTYSVPLSGSPATGCPQCTGNSFPLSASASTDGSQVYVAACDQYTQTNPPPAPPTCTAGSVHIVNTCAVLSCNEPPDIGLNDFQQVPYVNINNANNPNMCNNQGTPPQPLCLPNLIAVGPL